MSARLVAALVAAAAIALAQPHQRSVALTFDDLPMPDSGRPAASMHQVNSAILATLGKHNAPAIGFVNESKLYVLGEIDARVAVLKLWVDAGMELGNHTYSHRDINQIPLWTYQDDIVRGEAVTRLLMSNANGRLRYFRHPFTRTGATPEIKRGLADFLEQRGYIVAPFTVEHGDYIFETAYRAALSRNDAELAARIRADYITHLDTAFEHFEKLSRDVLGYEPPQILLVHANQINADSLDQMLTALERRGYRFVSLEEALRNRAYSLEDGYVGPAGISWIHRWGEGMKQKSRHAEDPDPPKYIVDAFNAR